MAKFFKKAYKYTPLGWLTQAYKGLGWSKPDEWMNTYLDEHEDEEVATQLISGLLGGLLTTGTGSKYKNSNGSDTNYGDDDEDYDEDNTNDETKKTKNSLLSKIVDALGGNLGSSLINGVLGLGTATYTNKINKDNADLAWQRQNEFYENHLSMPAKVREYQEAGLNPMGLAGAGAGATSAPQVAQAEGSASMVDALTAMLGASVNLRSAQANIAYTNERTTAQKIENEYARRNYELELQQKQQDYEKSLQDYEIGKEILRSSGLDADAKAVYVQYAPQLFSATVRKDNSIATLNEQESEEIKQRVAQAKERFPKEIKLLEQQTAQIQANIVLLKDEHEMNPERKKQIIEQTNKIIEERKKVVKEVGLVQKEIDAYYANHSQVQLVPDLTGDKDRVVVKHPDGTVTSFDFTGFEKTFTRDLDGNKVKKK